MTRVNSNNVDYVIVATDDDFVFGGNIGVTRVIKTDTEFTTIPVCITIIYALLPVATLNNDLDRIFPAVFLLSIKDGLESSPLKFVK